VKNQDLSQLVALVRGIFTSGRRVRFLEFGEVEPVALTAGAEGTVAFVDSIGTVHVNWDGGVGLGVIVHAHDGRKPDRIQPLGDGPNWPPVR
jgi:hypothetical protein